MLLLIFIFLLSVSGLLATAHMDKSSFNRWLYISSVYFSIGLFSIDAVPDGMGDTFFLYSLFSYLLFFTPLWFWYNQRKLEKIYITPLNLPKKVQRARYMLYAASITLFMIGLLDWEYAAIFSIIGLPFVIWCIFTFIKFRELISSSRIIIIAPTAVFVIQIAYHIFYALQQPMLSMI